RRQSTPMRLDAVIFDMDGLMIDTEAPVQICCQTAAAEMGFDLPDEFYVSALVGRGWTDCHTALTAHFGADFSLDEFMERFRQRWSEHRDVHGTPSNRACVSSSLFCEAVAY